MCTGVIGHCQCLQCVDHPAPGKLQRIDLCPDQQKKLAGVWVDMPSSGHEHKVAACDKLEFKRVGEPGACHFKDSDTKMKGADTKMKDADTKVKDVGPSGSARDSGAVSGSGIAFTPINAAAIAKAALSIADNADTSDQTQGKTTATAGDNGKHNVMITDKGTSAGTSTSITDRDSNLASQQTPKKTLTQPHNPNNTAAAPSVPATPTKPRTPLPTSRPNTPRVAKAIADALAAETAARVARGEWTPAETIKLLLLRVKEVGFEEEDVMGRYLPGREPNACAERLVELARKHGYEKDVFN